MVAHNPLHGSGLAGFPHPALASGDDAKSPQGVGVTDAVRGQPAVNEPPHPVPGNAAVLAAPGQRAVPEPADLETEDVQRRSVHGHAVIADVSTDDRAQPLAHFGNGVVHASREVGFHLAELRLQPFTNRLPRRSECGPPLILTASAPRRLVLSRLNTRPVRLPVNASTLPLQAAPHDSGPAWVASPSPYDCFIHTTMPV